MTSGFMVSLSTLHVFWNCSHFPMDRVVAPICMRTDIVGSAAIALMRRQTGRFIGWLDITASKFYEWRERYGKVNEHNGWVPRDFWLEDGRSRPSSAFI